MAWIAQTAGILLVLVVLEDVYFTVLFPGSGRGLLRKPLSRGQWRVFRLAARVSPANRDRLLSYNGPTLVAANVVVWICVLILAFACIYWPVLGTAIRTSPGPTRTTFSTALYMSGYALTTMGSGGVLPQTGPYRLILVLEAAIGFSTVTMVVTYFLSLYNALVQRNTFALSLQHRSAGTADAAELLARLGPGGDFSRSHPDITAMGTSLLHLLETHRAYPALRYFRLRDSWSSLPRMAFVTMDTVTLIRSALNAETYRGLVDSAAVAEAWGGGQQLLHGLSDTFVPRRFHCLETRPEQEWRERYCRAVQRLTAAGIDTTPDLQAGADRYVELRRQWAPHVAALAAYLLYDWSTVAPADTAP